MLALLQRVSSAKVEVNQSTIGEIQAGVLVLIGIERNDSEKQADRLLERILGYRIFCDEKDHMNLSVQNISGGLLFVPQFTLAADTKKGMRPSFTPAASPEEGRRLFEYILQKAKVLHHPVENGQFGAHMLITLCNDGPVTFLLKV